MVPPVHEPAYQVRSRLFPERIFIRVPWKQAARLRARLRERGLDAIVCYDPSDRTAGLEFRAGADQDAVMSAFRSASAEAA